MKSRFECKNKLTFFILSTVILLVYSCFSFPEYPDDWAPLQKPTSECLDISGYYHNIAVESKEFPDAPLLLELFQVSLPDILNVAWTGQAAVGFLIEQISYEQIRITAKIGNIVISQRELIRSKNDFDCTPDMIKISGPSETKGELIGETQGFVLEYSSSSFYISKDEEGALIVKEVASGGGVCCLFLVPIPLVGRQSSWYRYEPVIDEKN
jgi:hypothetical protein